MEDTKYLNYGDQQIEQEALLKILNDPSRVQRYVSDKPWTNTRKQKFLTYYADVVDNGILGAQVKTVNGQKNWVINTKKKYDLSTLDKTDAEMLNEVAHYIRLQMARMPIVTADQTKSDEATKVESTTTPEFDTDEFLSNLKKDISSDQFSTFNFDVNKWNTLDTERDPITREKSIKNRTNILRTHLENFRKNLTENKYNFENSPYKTYNNFTNRLDAVISALSNEDETDDEEAMRKFGLEKAYWFDKGLGEKVVNPDNGEIITEQDLATYNQKKTELVARQQAEAEKKKKNEEVKKVAEARAKANQYRSIYTLNYDPTHNKFWRVSDFINYKNINNVDDLLAYIKTQYSDVKSPDDFRKHNLIFQGAYKIFDDSNKLQQISEDTWKWLNKNVSKGINQDKSKLKQLPGIDNLIYDIETRKIYYLGTKSLTTKQQPNPFYDYKKKKMEELVKYYQNLKYIGL